MTVRMTKIEETGTSANMPSAAVGNWTTGINAPGGPVEFLTLRYSLNYLVGTPVGNGGISALIDSLRVVLNGEVVHDFTAGASGAGTEGPDQYAYLINGIGGRCVEVPNTADVKIREGYINIPLGRQTPAGVNRYEIIVNWAAAAQAIDPAAANSMSWWLRFNNNMQQTTTVCPATSFLSSASNEQVVVRVPQNVPGVVSAIAIFNESETDDYGTQGIRINALSDFGIEINQYRADNGDLDNGVQFNKGSTLDTQTYSTRVLGSILIPTYGLSGGDIVLAVDSTAAKTRRYLPIITNPVGARTKPDVVQTQASVGNTAKAILDGSLQ